MADPPTSQMIQPRSGRDTLAAHLEARYGIQASRLAGADLAAPTGPAPPLGPPP